MTKQLNSLCFLHYHDVILFIGKRVTRYQPTISQGSIKTLGYFLDQLDIKISKLAQSSPLEIDSS